MEPLTQDNSRRWTVPECPWTISPNAGQLLVRVARFDDTDDPWARDGVSAGEWPELAAGGTSANSLQSLFARCSGNQTASLQ